jgi:hypothetical protein
MNQKDYIKLMAMSFLFLLLIVGTDIFEGEWYRLFLWSTCGLFGYTFGGFIYKALRK